MESALQVLHAGTFGAFLVNTPKPWYTIEIYGKVQLISRKTAGTLHYTQNREIGKMKININGLVVQTLGQADPRAVAERR